MKRRILLNPWTLIPILIAVAILSLAMALFAVDRIGERIIDAQARRAASAEADYMVTLAREEGLAALITTMNRRERLHGGAGFRYALVDAKGRAIAGTAALNGISIPKGWKVVVLPDGAKQKTWHVLVGDLPTGQSLYVAQDTEQRSNFRGTLIWVSALALIFVTLACTLVGVLLSTYLLHRADGISRTAETIASGDLKARIPVLQHGDVFDRLGSALNNMLDRIEELMTGMRTITDSLAHDMRRPLSYIGYALERAADPCASEEMRTEAIADARRQADNALATFSALIDVARAESGLSAETMTSIDTVALARDVADLFDPLFEEAGQKFRLMLPDAMINLRVHEHLLRQAIGNLLHNAASHAGKGAIVTLSLVPVTRGLDIVVADTGPGILPADRGRVQERFVRLDPARSAPGSGLGLAIAAACAKLHGGALLLEDNQPGLRAILQLRSGAALPSAMSES